MELSRGAGVNGLLLTSVSVVGDTQIDDKGLNTRTTAQNTCAAVLILYSYSGAGRGSYSGSGSGSGTAHPYAAHSYIAEAHSYIAEVNAKQNAKKSDRHPQKTHPPIKQRAVSGRRDKRVSPHITQTLHTSKINLYL